MSGHAVNGKRSVLYILIAAVVAVMLFAAGMFVLAGSGNRDVSAESDDSLTKSGSLKIDDSSEHAKALYNSKIEDVNDTALVAELFEKMGLEDITGEYTVQISKEDDGRVLALDVTEHVQASDEEVFNGNMEKCAQQMLALIPQIDKVQWSYQLFSSSSSDESDKEAIVVAVNKEKFEQDLGKSPEDFGESADAVKKLLEKQAGK